MKKSTACIYVILFFLLFILPVPIQMSLGKYIDSTDYENREKAEMPAFRIEEYSLFPQKFEAYFNDAVPFRSQLLEANGVVNLFAFQQSPLSRVKVGKGGWLFYNPAGKDGDPIKDTTGENAMSEASMRLCAQNLVTVRDFLKEEGKEFVVMIAPNKGTMYKEYFPSEYKVAKQTRGDLLAAYLRDNTDLNLVYPKEELLAVKEEMEDYVLYYRTDTHWNHIGAYTGAKTLLSALDITLPGLDEVEIVETQKYAGDLAIMMAMTKYMAYDTVYEIRNHSGDTEVQSERIAEGKLDIVHYTTTDRDPRTLLLVHDSFSDAMIPYISAQFNECYYIHRNSFNSSCYDSIDPDVVIVQIVERNLDYLFKFGTQIKGT